VLVHSHCLTDPKAAKSEAIMNCTRCGHRLWFLARKCPGCGRDLSPYVHLLGVLGGLGGSFIGYSLFNMGGAIVGGLLGVLIYVALSNLRSRIIAKRS
jgi:hypothetical protein